MKIDPLPARFVLDRTVAGKRGRYSASSTGMYLLRGENDGSEWSDPSAGDVRGAGVAGDRVVILPGPVGTTGGEAFQCGTMRGNR